MAYLLLRIYSKIVHTTIILVNKLYKTRVKVFMFHHINENCEFSVSKDNFELFCQNLKHNSIIDIDSIFNEKLENKVCITFDDVPISVYNIAFPILQKYDIKFTLFVSTSLLDTKGYITTEQLIIMSKSHLCSIGSHGVSHSSARLQTDEDFKNEIFSSKLRLEQILNQKIKCYAFPYGTVVACSLRKIKLLSNSSIYDMGFSTIKTHISTFTQKNKFFLPRIDVSDSYINNYINNKLHV